MNKPLHMESRVSEVSVVRHDPVNGEVLRLGAETCEERNGRF